MAVVIYGGVALILAAGLTAALKRRFAKRRRRAQPRRQTHVMRGTITVPLGRNSCT